MFAVHRGFPAHPDAKSWLDGRLSGPERVGLPWGSLLAFVRLSATPAVVPRPLSLRDAMAVVSEWLGLPSTWVPEPTERHAATVASLLDGESKPDLVPDAHLAGLRWTDPLRG
jgi:uncharacterized protein